MPAFEIYLNDKQLCRAGVGEQGVVSAHVAWVGKPRSKSLTLHVGGLISPTNENVSWIQERALNVGDEVRIKIAEGDYVDEPAQRYRIDPARDLRARKNHVLTMAKEFGWKVDKKPGRSTRRKNR
jgi:hypothetical protein